MYKNRLLLTLSVLSLLLVSMVVSNSRLTGSPSNIEAASDFHQRHPGWTWVVIAKASMPVTGAAVRPLDTTDYFFRHSTLAPSVNSIDLTDYFFRHPELPGGFAAVVDKTDYYFRHSGN